MSDIRHLINYFIPDNYKIDLSISKSKREFNGTVTIAGEPQNKDSQIRLHAKNLIITKLLADNKPTKWTTEDDEIIVDGQPKVIAVNFIGKLSDEAMNGLYLCKYRVDGQVKELFTTQFESHYARECFPCIDEPAAKATFDITITTNDPDDKIVLSNMPGTKSGQTWKFETTPRMSTYLLAFVGGDLISKSTTTNRGVAINTYATPAQPAESLDYALEVAKKSVEFFENYFNIEYPLPKLDNVAVPDFSAGAMENWGLITYRETAILADVNTGESERELVATVIAHEISHQWFGNLVTMQWWNDLWLNESFASLMENTAVDKLYPDYHIWEDYEFSDVISALKRDAIPWVQAVRQDVNSPDEIATLFDGAIVYAKGQRLIKMLLNYIGEGAFRGGLTNYFRKFAYKNTIADDLWQELSASSGINVKELMNLWLTTPGYPIITAEKIDNEIGLTQQSFYIDGTTDDKIWSIPLFANDKVIPDLLTEKSVSLSISDIQRPLHLNVNNAAHYITKFDDELFNELVLHFNELSIADRMKLLRESLLLSLAGQQDISNCLKLLQQAKGEQNQAVISVMSWIIGNLNTLTEHGSIERRQLKEFTKELFQDDYIRLFENANQDWSINDRKSRSVVLARSFYGKNKSAIDYCLTIYNANQNNISNIDGDIRQDVLEVAVAVGDEQNFADLWKTYSNCQNANLRQDICYGITSTKKLDQIAELLNNVTDINIVRPQDNFYFISYLMANSVAHKQTWQWIRDNWDWIKRVFGGDMSYDTYIRIASGSLRTKNELTEYDEFFASINQNGIERVIKIGHDDIASRINWIERNKDVLVKELSAIITNQE